VLVVGAGTGNDVASAVRNGAGHVDAVEIDPAIINFGRLMHPERPYAQPNVRAIVNDARAHLRHTDRKYDLIVYGLLDSHSLLSGIGSVRLDSYIYTVDAFRDARARLKPGGVIVLTFAIIRDELGKKLYLMLKDAFGGKEPAAFQVQYDAGVAFVIGDELPADVSARAASLGMNDVGEFLRNPNLVADESTDDWPFFYMPVRKYPVSYAVMIVALLAVAFVFVRRLTPAEARGFSPPCFLLGAGFMLLETKAITELALFYGSTWVVVGVVIAAILVMAFLANLLLIRLTNLPVVVAYGLLLASLGLSLGLSYSRSAPGGGGEAGEWTTRLIRTAIITLPLFFAGVAFSTELRGPRRSAWRSSSNLLGAMLGGCLEYNAMYFGYRSLYVLAMAVYAMALVSSVWRGGRAESPAQPGAQRAKPQASSAGLQRLDADVAPAALGARRPGAFAAVNLDGDRAFGADGLEDFSRSYCGCLKDSPSHSQTFRSLIQVVIFGYLPAQRTLTLFHSSIFHALVNCSPVAVETR
jgi:SAM-dependent methyltransferase